MDDLSLPPERKGIPGWAIALLVLVGFGVIGLVAVGGAAFVLVPKIQEQQKRAACADHLRQLGALRSVGLLEQLDDEPDGGARYILRLLEHAGGGAHALVCPGDPHAVTGQILEVGTGEQDPATAPVFRAMCSYMVRDFARYPVDPGDPEAVIAADANDHGAHHKGGINVLYADGSVRFRDRKALGIPKGVLIVVGPDSPHPELMKLCIVPAR